jgi:hypothetical protein
MRRATPRTAIEQGDLADSDGAIFGNVRQSLTLIAYADIANKTVSDEMANPIPETTMVSVLRLSTMRPITIVLSP